MRNWSNGNPLAQTPWFEPRKYTLAPNISSFYSLFPRHCYVRADDPNWAILMHGDLRIKWRLSSAKTHPFLGQGRLQKLHLGRADIKNFCCACINYPFLLKISCHYHPFFVRLTQCASTTFHFPDSALKNLSTHSTSTTCTQTKKETALQFLLQLDSLPEMCIRRANVW